MGQDMLLSVLLFITTCRLPVRDPEKCIVKVMAEWRATVSETKLNLTVAVLQGETRGQTQALTLMYELGTFLLDL